MASHEDFSSVDFVPFRIWESDDLQRRLKTVGDLIVQGNKHKHLSFADIFYEGQKYLHVTHCRVLFARDKVSLSVLMHYCKSFPSPSVL